MGVMEEEVERINLYDLQLRLPNVDLTPDELNELEALDNVNHVEPRTIFVTRMYIGERLNDAFFVGVEDFGGQQVDKVTRSSGSWPGTGEMEVLAEDGNVDGGVYDGDRGDDFDVVDHRGGTEELSITGTGRCMVYADLTGYAGFAV